MIEKLRQTDDGIFFKYEVADDATNWFKTQASVMIDYDIVHMRLVTSFEILMYMRVLPCPEVNKLYITYIKGVYIDIDNYTEPLTFDLDYIKESMANPGGSMIPMSYAGTSFMAEVRRALHALFSHDWTVDLFDQDAFDDLRRRFLMRNLVTIKRIAPVPLHQTVTSCIWERCKPKWYDFSYVEQAPITMRVWVGLYIYDDAYLEV